ncbi:MAG: hypothetical protein ABW176_20190 [Candidatus Thiodiazotropha endolucinida]
MPVQEIQFALNSLKTALDVGSFILKADNALDKAMLKIELEKMIDALVDAKQTVRELDDRLYEKDKIIEDLTQKLKNTNKTIGFLGARYYIGENGEPTGAPFCPTCWATKKELVPLTAWSNKEHTHKCGSCGNTIESRRSPLSADNYIKSNRESAEKMKMEFTIETYE